VRSCGHAVIAVALAKAVFAVMHPE